MRFNKARKELNRELRWVARGESPSRALSCLYQMFSRTLAECDDDAEIMEWTTKMIIKSAKWQAGILSPNAVAKGLTEAAEQIKQYYYGFGADMEEQGDGGVNHEI